MRILLDENIPARDLSERPLAATAATAENGTILN